MIERRYTLAFDDELDSLAVELIRANPDVIVAFGTPSTLAVQKATRTMPIVFAEGARITEAVRKARVPAVFPWREFQQYGVAMIYDTDLKDTLRRGAYFVDRILKGASPAELPVEQVSTTTLIIDLRVAREQGIKIPEDLVYRADQVIR